MDRNGPSTEASSSRSDELTALVRQLLVGLAGGRRLSARRLATSLSRDPENQRPAGTKAVNQALYGHPQLFSKVRGRGWPFSAHLWALTAAGSTAARQPYFPSRVPRLEAPRVSTGGTVSARPVVRKEASDTTDAIGADLIEEEPPEQGSQPASNDELRRLREKAARRNPPPIVNSTGWSALYKGAIHPGHPTFGLSDSVRDSMANEIEPYIDSD